jgi:Fe-S cluster biogenesis protein NfuA
MAAGALEGRRRCSISEGNPIIQDPQFAGLLIIHGLHPLDLETRLLRALDKVRPYMESHAGTVEFLGLRDGVARLRLKGTCKSCPSSKVTLELAVRKAIEEACPDLTGQGCGVSRRFEGTIVAGTALPAGIA